jgi:hypothetical protein
MRIFYLILLALCIQISTAKAQYASQKDASYLATLKAVLDFKMKDEENLNELAALRENKNFNKKLSVMMEKLSNNRAKNSTNNKIYKILIKAGKDIYNELN